ncbi:MAG TPA: GNAT family N-acetyltransferase [Acidimicrobiia bacterium]
MSTVPRISDGVVVLRDIVDTDSEAIYECLTTDADIARWTRIPWPYTRGHLHDFMGLVGRARLGRSDLVLAIADPADDRLVGCIGIHRIGSRAVPRSAMLPDEVGYWIAREVRGQGRVTRAVRMLSAYALAELGVACLNLQTKVGNAASQRVATNTGYRYVERVPATDVDDDLSDYDRFAMRRDDYERTNGRLADAALFWSPSESATVTPTASGSVSAP